MEPIKKHVDGLSFDDVLEFVLGNPTDLDMQENDSKLAFRSMIKIKNEMVRYHEIEQVIPYSHEVTRYMTLARGCFILYYNILKITPTHSDVNITDLTIKVKQQLNETYIAKNRDYGNAFIETIEIFGRVAFFTRIYDKLNRIETLYNNREDILVVDETIEDTLLDIINYCTMFIRYLHITNKVDIYKEV